MSAEVLREAAREIRIDWREPWSDEIADAAFHLSVADWLEAEATALDAMANFTTAAAEMEYETTIRGAALTVHKTEAGEITFRADTSAPALKVARAYLDRSRPEGSGNPGVTGAQPDEPASQAGRPARGDA